MNPLFRTLASLVFLVCADSNAASVSFFLDQSNVLPDGPDYLKVTVDNEGPSGAINFHVSVLDALSELAPAGVGIQRFGFNSNWQLRESDIVGLPPGWSLRGRERMDGFGKFDYTLQGPGRGRVTSLAFSIADLPGDTPWSYISSSEGKAGAGNQLFASRVGGFLWNVGKRSGEHESDGDHRHDGHHDSWSDRDREQHGRSHREHFLEREDHDRGRTIGYFGGGTPVPLVVPIPPAGPLLLAGLFVFAALARRNRAARPPLDA